MAEMILPGTYIEVRAEGLIVPGPISIGNVAIVGTARRGPLNTPVIPSDIGEARAIFGQYDALDNPDETGSPLTLVRALELAYANGAQNVYALRVARGGGANAAAAATFDIATSDSNNVVATSKAPGSGYNGAVIEMVADGAELTVTITVDTMQESWRSVPVAAADFAAVLNGSSTTYSYATLASTRGGSDLFTFDAAAATGDVVAGSASAGTPGSNGATATATEYTAGLDALQNENVHIVVVAGQTAGSLGAALTAHVENASTDAIKRERIGVIGTNSDTLNDLLAHGMDSSRIVFVGPGIRVNDAASGQPVPLTGEFAAAAVAGLISSLSPHFSPTNKTLRVNGVSTVFNGTQLEQLLLGRVLALESRNGAVKVVQGLTSASDTAFRQITTRRIVDYARMGVRSAADPFIGRLNNDRVRAALKGAINGFLADMVDQEMLIQYELDVSATREQQIRGIAAVTMILQPTFSIDYIRVTMYLE